MRVPWPFEPPQLSRRLLEAIGNVPPAEAEARYYASLETPALAAKIKPHSLRQTRTGSQRRYADDQTCYPFGPLSVYLGT